MRKFLGPVVLTATSLTIALVLIEVVVRVMVPPALWQFRDATHDWQLDLEIGWVNRPDLDVTSRGTTGLVRFRTNSDGLIPAGAQRAKPSGTFRVMVFGDSMVVGRDVPQDQTYPAMLETLLRERGLPAEVINAGVLGYSTDQALLLMQRWVPVYRPDVVLYGSTVNDLGGNVLAHANAQAKPRFHLDPAGELVFEPPVLDAAIRRYGRGPRAWIQYSALYRALQPRIFVLRARLAGSNQRILLGDMQELYLNPSVLNQIDWDLYAALVDRMQEVANDNAAHFLFFAHPEVGEVWDPYIAAACERLGQHRSSYDPFSVQKRAAAGARLHGVAFLHMIEPFRAHPERGPFHLLPHDAHLGANGHALLAELLSDALVPALPQARSGTAR